MLYKEIIFKIFAVFVCCIVVPLFIWLLCLVSFAPAAPTTRDITYSKCQFQTGDFILFSGTSIVENGIKTIQNSCFSHICLVLYNDLNNQQYILEVDAHPKRKQTGVHLMLLKQKLHLTKHKRNNGQQLYFAHVPFIGDNSIFPSFAETQKFVEEYQYYNRDLTFFAWFGSSWPHLIKYLRPDKSVFCSELLAIYLERYKIVKLLHHPTWYSPESLKNSTAIVCLGTCQWGKTQIIEY